MKRDVDINEISDGKFYGPNDMVKADCNGCRDCHACCTSMGRSVLLDPLDIYRLTSGLEVTFEELLTDSIELNVVDGVILPNLKMRGENESCSFLNEEGRCSVHAFRPGICRLFPLGRYYEDHGFRYFLQVHECRYPNKTKVKVKKWIDTPNLEKNSQYILDWHDFVLEVQNMLSRIADDELFKKIDMFILQHFFIERYTQTEDFYEQFYARLAKAKEVIATLRKRI